MKKSSILTKKVIGIPVTLLTDKKYRSIVKEEFKNKYGIYALYNKKGKLYYVGLAHNSTLEKRIRQHLRDKHSNKWDSFSIFFTKKKQYIRDIESIILSIVPETKGNTQKAKWGRDGELKSRIRKAMKEIDKETRTFRKIGSTKKKKRKKKKRVSLKNYFKNVRPLKREYKNKVHKAKLLKSGKIRYEGKDYETPSAAAKAVIKVRSPNGWIFWFVKDHKNKWVKLSKLN